MIILPELCPKWLECPLMYENLGVFNTLRDRIPLWLEKQMIPRNEKGWREHGAAMKAHDGRDFAMERHEELLDAIVYQQAMDIEKGRTFINISLFWLLRLILWLSNKQLKDIA